MDFSALIKGEIDKKKKQVEKYTNKDGQIDRKQAENDRIQQYEQDQKEREAKKRKLEEQEAQEAASEQRRKEARRRMENRTTKLDLTPEEVKAKLREIGEPENQGEDETDSHRYKRMKKMVRKHNREKERERENDILKSGSFDVAESEDTNLAIRGYLKHLLQIFDSDQTRKEIEPLMNLMRDGALESGMFDPLKKVLVALQKKDYRQANIEYTDLSIGKAAWPVGVIAVGIHARSNLSKITGDDGSGANIMKSETTRLWITAIKRLVTYCEENGL